MNRLTVMDGTGDTEFKWDPANPEECARMRETVATLKAQGFVFWLVDGSPADEVSAGNGTLVVRRRLEAEEVASLAQEAAHEPAAPKKRGRPARSASVPLAAVPGPEVVAHRPMRGG